MRTKTAVIAASCLVFCLAILRAQEVTTERNVLYGEAGGQKLLLDVFLPKPAGAAARPAVIFIHGGGWSAGSKEMYDQSCTAVAKGGFVAFSINYRLVTRDGNRWPAQLDDAQRAVRWIRAQAGRYGIDPQRIGAMGHSAGGHLAACLGTRETRDNSDPALAGFSSRVTCVIDLSGPTDLLHGMSAGGDPIVRALLGGAPAERLDLARDASPLDFVDAKSAPFLIFHGRDDALAPPEQAERLDAALRKAGVESKLIVFEGEGHGFTRKENAQRLVGESVAFFKRHLLP